MKTRSMSRKASSLISNTTSTNSGSIQMEVDDVPTASATCRTRDAVPARVTRSRRANENGNEQNLSRVQSKSSAIPNDFSFHVPAGVESFVFGEDTFHFKPLSPNSAKKFFPTVELPSETEQTCPTQRDKGKMKDGEETTSVEMNGDLGCEEEIKKHELDATYFRNLADSEVERLKSRFANWEGESDREELVPEEVKGMIRTVIGQVQLLVNKKFKQFYGLLDLSEDPTAEKKALVSDLQGFWDMMYIQVEKIDKQFRELEEMRENNWQEKNTQIKTTKKNVKRTAKPKKSSQTSNSKVSENRNKFREMRAQLKAKMQAEKNGNEDAFKIILTPMKNRKADADPSEPQIILTPVRRSTRKSRGCPNIAIPLVNLPNVSVDLFGACKAPETVASNECAVSNVLDDSIFRPRRSTSAATPLSTSDDLMVFSPTTPAKRGNAYTAS